jgi:anthranilate synthase/aminodeoxychorismate synthase-like glutamine amidotransferase
MKIFLLNNHDSFTYNLAALIRSFDDTDLHVAVAENTNIASLAVYDKIVFSPGPGLPAEFSMMKLILDTYKESKSILGVCLGHQMIAEYFGGRLVNLETVNHGWIKELIILQEDSRLFHNIPQASKIGVYHSWYVSRENLPDCFTVTAECGDKLIMALEHKTMNLDSVQFHPESFITSLGRQMIANWLKK